ncbi:hypothetical protein IQ266_25155 [filamentous cyanobacterium LEGE 11480]|uniref:Uncharacterized protein n=1 Tax=Romeriopsis navalis LEGE 11480 TaxID=2777977 RepID=A0A928VVL3_9CYAN|nr:hypothetical protein [Romeriopsis navalis]MBE9033029.1 hypothetical protein [Romeriopsis navalis LEGE 11480]
MTQQSDMKQLVEQVAIADADGVALDRLLNTIATDPQFAALKQQVESGSQTTATDKGLIAFLRKCLIDSPKALLTANAADFHGKSYVTPSLQRESEVTAGAVTVSSILDLAGNQPLMYYAFKGASGDLLWSLILNVGLLKFTNYCSAIAAGGKHGTRLWSAVGTIGLLSLSVIRSIASPVGSELLNNMPAINRIRAVELIQAHEHKLAAIKNQPNPLYATARQRCEQGKQELRRLDRSDRRWSSRYVRLYGRWHERNKDWSGYQLAQVPLCMQPQLIQGKHLATYEVAKQDWQKKLQRRSLIGDDRGFLQQEMPALYAAHFDAEGNLRSGVDAVRIATQNLYGKLQRGDWQETGFSLMFFGISAATSATACLLSLSLSRRADARKSRSQAIAQVRDAWLDARYQELAARRQAAPRVEPSWIEPLLSDRR